MRSLRIKNASFAAALAASGKTQIILAEECGISPVTISRLMCNRQAAKRETAEKIARALNTDVRVLALELVEGS